MYNEKKLPGGLVGEKSQTVYSANWKLDSMLQKNLQMLDVSKQRVSHSITMDQRVVNKRFQTQLHRSKIAHARMTGNTELLRELLRHSANYTFNTSVGGQDDKYTVRIAPSKSPSPQYRDGKGRVRPASTPILIVNPAIGTLVDNQARDNETVACDGQRTESAEHVQTEPRKKRPLNSLSTTVTERIVSHRPASVAAPSCFTEREVKETKETSDYEESAVNGGQPPTGNTSSSLSSTERTDTQKSSVAVEVEHEQQPHVTDNKERKIRPKTAMAGISKTPPFKSSTRSRPQTAAPSTLQDSLLAVPTPVVTEQTDSLARRPRTSSNCSHAERTNTRQRKHALPSVFGEEKQPTLLDVNRARLLESNFPNRLRQFAGRVKSLQTDPQQTMDYYTLRLIENIQSAGHLKGPRKFIESAAERRDADRSIGNLKANNMTFGNVQGPHQEGVRRTPGRVPLPAWEPNNEDNDVCTVDDEIH